MPERIAKTDPFQQIPEAIGSGPTFGSVPTLWLHGEEDQIVPIIAAGLKSAKIVKNAKLKVYPGYPHGMCQIHADEINADLLAFFKS